jgi:hypothetical protein
MPVACRDVAWVPAGAELAPIPSATVVLGAADHSVRSSLAGASGSDLRIEPLSGHHQLQDTSGLGLRKTV